MLCYLEQFMHDSRVQQTDREVDR